MVFEPGNVPVRYMMHKIKSYDLMTCKSGYVQHAFNNNSWSANSVNIAQPTGSDMARDRNASHVNIAKLT